MAFLKHTPRFTEQEAVSLTLDLYGIRAGAVSLPGERDRNFLMETASGERFVLKIANAAENRDMLEMQNRAMSLIAESLPVCPRVHPTRGGDLIAEARSIGETTHQVRLLTYLPGVPMARVRRHSEDLLLDLGRRLAQVDRVLAGFEHPGARRPDFQWDLANGPSVVKAHAALIQDGEIRKEVEAFAEVFEEHFKPLLSGLRRSVIHNDANDHNVIVGGGDDLRSRNQQVVGLIDFGDMVHGYTVGDPAVAIAYAVLNKPDPLAAATRVVEGYHSEYPLTENEIAALFGLAGMRLCMSACLAAYQQGQRPEDEYLSISQEPIRNTLPVFKTIHHRFAEAAFRKACGLVASPRSEAVCRWLEKTGKDAGSVMDWDFRRDPCPVLDLGMGSPLAEGDAETEPEPDLTRRLFGKIRAAGARVGIGRYDEARMLYTSPRFSTGNKPTDEHRTVHMGMDLFAEPGSPVYAPLEGRVHLFGRNHAPLDYGPMIILEHETDRGDRFYTLYGHLAAASLGGLEVGRPVKKGRQIGTIGTAEVNGGWTPHLHFQVITDLLDLGRDFPGVVRSSRREIWKSFSPDPNLVLGIPEGLFPEPEPGKAETLALRRRTIGRNLSIGYWNPVKVLRGQKQYLFDETGRRYLDAYNNVPHVGHCHPRVIEAAVNQMKVLNTNTRYLHDFINRYAERLGATMPDPLSVCFFVNSASEGNELALRLARSFTGRRDMIVLEAAYHGHTTSLIDISPYKHDGPGGGGAPSWVHTAPVADVYRGPYKAADPRAGKKYARHVGDIVQRLREQGRGPAGFIAESCPSVGGQIFFPDGYLAEVYRHVRGAGGLCIADEVQTGYGRIGTHFYAFEAQGVVPDIVVLGKPIGNGHPISAVVTTPEIADAFDNGMEFFSTFGGNTVSCAVGLAVLEVVREEGLQQNALLVGNRMLEGMRGFGDLYPVVGDVRGSGLFLGVELVRDRNSLEPAAEEASFLVNRMRERGILMGTDGPHHNVVKIRPPMPFSEGDADLLVGAMAEILENEL